MDKSIEPVAVRDIYKLEFDLFQDPVWVFFYVFSVGVFVAHVYMGWKKLVTASVFKIPKGLQGRVIIIGNCHRLEARPVNILSFQISQVSSLVSGFGCIVCLNACAVFPQRDSIR